MNARLQIDNIKISVRTPVPYGDISEMDLLRLAAAASDNHGNDPGDKALIHAADTCAQTVGWEQKTGSWTPPTNKRHYSTAIIRPAGQTTGDIEIARGSVDALMDLCNLSAADKASIRKNVKRIKRKGFRPSAVAINREGFWQFCGFVPIFAMRVPLSVRDAQTEFRYFHIWDWSLRLLHWMWVLCVLGLIATGFCIAEGWFIKFGDLESGNQFGNIRRLHFILAWILIGVIIMRFATFFFATNKYQKFSTLFPIKKQQWKDLYETARDYLLAKSFDAPRYIGHNPLQQWTYTGVYGLFTLMIVTGLTLYALYEPANWFFGLFMPINDILGVANVRLIHVIGTWCFMLFITIHVYLSALAGNVDRDGTISSMVSGGRWLRKGAHFRDE